MNNKTLKYLAGFFSFIGISAETIGALGMLGKLHIFPTLNYSLIAGGALFTLIALSACIIASSISRESKLALFLTLLAGTLTSAVYIGVGCHGVLPFSLPHGLILGLYFLSIALVAFACFIAKPNSRVRNFVVGAACVITFTPVVLFVIALLLVSDGACLDPFLMAAICNQKNADQTAKKNVSPKQSKELPEVAANSKMRKTAAGISSDDHSLVFSR